MSIVFLGDFENFEVVNCVKFDDMYDMTIYIATLWHVFA